MNPVDFQSLISSIPPAPGSSNTTQSNLSTTGAFGLPLTKTVQPISDTIEKPSLGTDLKNGFKETVNNVKNSINGSADQSQGEPAIVRGVQATAAGFHGLTDAIGTVATHAYNAIPDFLKNNAAANAENIVPGGQLLTHVLGSIIPKEMSIIGDKAQEVGNSTQVQSAANAIYSWQLAHPDASKNLESVLKLLKGTGEISGDISVADLGAGAVKDTASTVADIVKQAPIADTAASVAANSNAAIQAVNPDLSGKALTGAYKEVVTGGRDISPSGLFSEQTLSPSQRAIQTGTRLSTDIPLTSVAEDGTAAKIPSLKFGSNPIKNLGTLADNLETTETQLETALKGDPEINMNAQKPILQQSLEDLKTGAPREFTAIKDNKAVYDSVIDFGQEQVSNAEDSIEGLRNARSSFDAQAQKEFPSAYRDGSIDTKTPAGRAIKSVRDTMNDHLYNTAPNGSDIKSLIQREADIFNARDAIAPKAAATDGINWFEKFSSENPRAAKLLKYGAAAAGGGLVLDGLKHVGL